jgi:predicted transport protein
VQKTNRDGTRTTKKLKQKIRREGINLDVDQCVDLRWVFNKRVSEIGSLGLQKLVITTTTMTMTTTKETQEKFIAFNIK